MGWKESQCFIEISMIYNIYLLLHPINEYLMKFFCSPRPHEVNLKLQAKGGDGGTPIAIKTQFIQRQWGAGGGVIKELSGTQNREGKYI